MSTSRKELVLEELDRRRTEVHATAAAELEKHLKLSIDRMRFGVVTGERGDWYQVKVPISPDSREREHLEKNVARDVARALGVHQADMWYVCPCAMGPGEEDGLSFTFAPPSGYPEAGS